MYRLLLAGAALALLTLAPRAAAQDPEEAWKNLFMQALSAAGANDFPKAEQGFVKALEEATRFGAQDPRVGTTLNSIGLVYRAEKKFPEAESAYRRAVAILEKSYPAESIDIANVNFNIASVMFDQGHQAEALPYTRKTLAAYEKLLGPTSVKTGAALCLLGDSMRLLKDFKEAEGPLRRCADVGEGKYVLAEPRFKLAEKIRESLLGITSPLLAQTMEDHAALLKSLGREQDAGKLLNIASAIRRNQKKTN
jgi:tetratricopeptide (TPR) repeat protein